jgi:xylose isomerase
MLARVSAPVRSAARQLGTRQMSEFYPGISPIQYEGPKSTNPMAFKHYQKDQMIMGKTMEEHLRFSVVYWHTFRNGGHDPFGIDPTVVRPWEDTQNGKPDSMDNALRRVDAAFEFFTKLGVPYYAFHDIDAAPEGNTLAECESNLGKVTDHLLARQNDTGVKLLWATQNMFSHPRFMNGASTNPDIGAFSWACAKTRHALDAGHKLGAENHVFWGGREGFSSYLNTDVRKELDNMAAFLHMCVDYKAKIGADYQLMIEPKPREPCKHQYDYDAQTVMGFLHTYGLEDHFKTNVEPNHTTLAGHNFEHDIIFSSIYGMLGSIDANTGDMTLGWDTDQFCTDVADAVRIMLPVLKQGGLGKGGLNFDAKVRRESTNLEDFYIAHIGGMDAYAHALKISAAIVEDGVLEGMVKERYSSFDSDLGKKLAAGTASLEEFEAHATAMGEPEKFSGQQELYEQIFMNYVYNGVGQK